MPTSPTFNERCKLLRKVLQAVVADLQKKGYIGDADKWITLPKSGEHVKLGENGEVKAGMGGKFTGQKINEVGKTTSSPERTNKPASSTPAAPTVAAAPVKPATGNKAHAAAQAKLSPAETEALKNYTGSMYVDLNARLRAGKPISKGDKKDFEQMQKAFSAASTTENMTVFRGINGEKFANLKPGESFSDKAYSSTSTNKDTANVFSGYGDTQSILNIEVPKGSRAISAESFSAFKSGGKSENEIILDKDANYVVTKVDPPSRSKPRVIHVKYVQSTPASQ